MMKDSRENEKRVFRTLYPEGVNGDPRRARMRSAIRSFGTFCQWCGGVRETVGTSGNYEFKVCPKHDTAPDSPVAAEIGVK
ncbi:MAG TPA: hypothetical protein VIG24_02255 [Acidimicrobiia bacterium]